MNKICVVGCGNVGMAYVHEIALKAHFVEEIVLLDIDKQKAEGEALDIMHTMPFNDNYMLVHAGDYADCADANLLVITAGKNQKKGGETRQELLKSNAEVVISIIKSAEKAGFKGVYLIATNPVDVLTYIACTKCGVSASRIIGTGTTLDSARLKYALSAKLGINPRSINGYVLGEHGDSEFVAWSVSNISGANLSANLDEATKIELEKEVINSAYKIIDAKGYTNFGVGACLYALTKAVLCNENEVFTASALHVQEDMCYSSPVVVGAKGVVNKITLDLSATEKEKLNESIAKLRESYKNYKK